MCWKEGPGWRLQGSTGQEGTFTSKWESRGIFLGKDMGKLDPQDGFDLEIGARRWKQPIV